MHINAKGEFQVKGWDEKPYHEEGSRKQTLAIVDQAFSGEITGEGAARWLMSYAPDGTAHFVGLQHVDGAIQGRQWAAGLRLPRRWSPSESFSKTRPSSSSATSSASRTRRRCGSLTGWSQTALCCARAAVATGALSPFA